MFIFEWISEIIAERQAANRQQLHVRGYEYAAGQLLGGFKPFSKLENECSDGFDRTEFDRGMQRALHDAVHNSLVHQNSKSDT